MRAPDVIIVVVVVMRSCSNCASERLLLSTSVSYKCSSTVCEKSLLDFNNYNGKNKKTILDTITRFFKKSKAEIIIRYFTKEQLSIYRAYHEYRSHIVSESSFCYISDKTGILQNHTCLPCWHLSCEYDNFWKKAYAFSSNLIYTLATARSWISLQIGLIGLLV